MSVSPNKQQPSAYSLINKQATPNRNYVDLSPGPTTKKQGIYGTSPIRQISSIGGSQIIGSYIPPVVQAPVSVYVDPAQDYINSKVRFDQAVRDSTVNLERSHILEQEALRARINELELRNQLVSGENNKLQDEINFHKAKILNTENDKNLQLNATQSLNAQEINQLRKDAQDTQLILSNEINRLKEEIAAKGTRNAQLQSDLQIKINELENARYDISCKEAALAKAQREARDAQELLEFRNKENNDLVGDKSNLQLQVYTLEQNNLALKEENNNLKAQVDSLRNEIENLNVDKTKSLEIRDRVHENAINELKKSHNLQEQALREQIQSAKNVIANKDQEILNTRSHNKQLNENLLLTQAGEMNAKQEAEVWKTRSESAEKQREYELRRAHELREAEVRQLQQKAEAERIALQNRLDSINKMLLDRDSQLRDAQGNLMTSEQTRRQLEAAKASLENQVKDLCTKTNNLENSYQNQLRVQNDNHNRDLANTRNIHNYEKDKLQQDITGLRSIIDHKNHEIINERTNAHAANIRAADANDRERSASIEAQYWRNTSQEIEKRRSIDLMNAENLRRSQINNMERQHSQELLAQEAQKTTLKSIIANREAENSNIKAQHSKAVIDYINAEQQRKQQEQQANTWKGIANSEANARNIERVNHTNQLNLERNEMRKSLDLANQTHQIRENTLTKSLVDKQREADTWKTQAVLNDRARVQEASNAIYYRNAANQELIARQATENLRQSQVQELKRSMELQQNIHNSQVSNLLVDNSRKQNEADSWRLQAVNEQRGRIQEATNAVYYRNAANQEALARQASENLRHSQVGELKRSMELQQNVHNSQVSNLLIDNSRKQQESDAWRSQAIVNDRARVQESLNANFYRNAANQEAHNRVVERVANDNLRNSQVNDLRRSIELQGLNHASQVSSLAADNLRKQREADEWRNNYNKVVSRSIYRY